MTATKLGVWMDHEHAYLTEFTVPPMKTQIIKANSKEDTTEDRKKFGELRQHTKEQHQTAEYFKKLSESIRHYKEVILFGPTDAKEEFFNTIQKNHLFADIEIHVQQADHMTENQKHAFIKTYFTRH
ncbi:MAG: hypothetical protein ABI663_07470 [Chryseolinea sp.]